MTTKLSHPSLTTTPRLAGSRVHQDWDRQADKTSTGINKILAGYQTTNLEAMKSVALQDRTDTKYIFHSQQLIQALVQLSDHYRVLEIEGLRLHAYQNLYFDSPNLALFDQHHRGLRPRYKVRCREYADSNLTYLEIKRRDNRERTVKKRLRTTTFVEDLAAYKQNFLELHFPLPTLTPDLRPVLWNDFQRITLVGKAAVERLTLDINLAFSDGWERVGLPGLAVAEVKQQEFSLHSAFMHTIRPLGIQPQRFSKYCMGIPMFYPKIKANRFKRRVLLVERIMREPGSSHNSGIFFR
jgi:hypothetical protein